MNKEQIKAVASVLSNRADALLWADILDPYTNQDRVRIASAVFKVYENQSLHSRTPDGVLKRQQEEALPSFMSFLFETYPGMQKDLFQLRPGYFQYIAHLTTPAFDDWVIKQMVRNEVTGRRGGYMRYVEGSVPKKYMRKVFIYMKHKTEELSIRAVSLDGFLIQYVPQEYRTKRVLEVAVQSWPGALSFAPPPHDLSYVLPALKANPSLLEAVVLSEEDAQHSDALYWFIMKTSGPDKFAHFSKRYPPSEEVKAYMRSKALQFRKFPKYFIEEWGFSDEELSEAILSCKSQEEAELLTCKLSLPALEKLLASSNIGNLGPCSENAMADLMWQHGGNFSFFKYPDLFPAARLPFAVFYTSLKAEPENLLSLLSGVLEQAPYLLSAVPKRKQTLDLVKFVVKLDPSQFGQVGVWDEELKRLFNTYVSGLSSSKEG